MYAPLSAALLALVIGCARQEPPPPPEAGGSPPEAAETAGADGVSGELVIFHAASLGRPFETIEAVLEAENPDLDVVRESSSSRVACRKVSELGRTCDVLATADYLLLRDMLVPDHARWYVAFARNRVVIAYSDRSKYHSEINVDNWYDILLRDDVQYGYAEPDQAPVGYRTLLTWKLAGMHYDEPGRDLFEELLAGAPESNIRPHCNELIPLVQSLGLDYIFQYQSVARQHNLQFLQLPPEIDLSSEKHAELYSQVSVELSGATRGETMTRTGAPIVYGITVPAEADNPAAGVAFLELLMSERGNNIMEESFQEPVVPALTPDPGDLPEELVKLVEEADL
ncbi:MAG: tungstate ABC transporter substrate-binding protein WtpA [Armatimonadia bacterium]|nr:tungstate ABC transporter substrate-binding protein WtpA [Armatimonadia bacterium]